MASHKLLLADDSVTIQRVIELTFSSEDVQVISVGDGEEAIARIASERPDVVLADIGMPKRSGYDVAAFVKGNADLKHIPVVLLAGAFEPVDENRARQAGSDGVLVKPFEPQHVIARVRELLGGAKGSPTQAATADIPRPVTRLAGPRPVELPKRDRREAISVERDDFDFGGPSSLPASHGLRPRAAQPPTPIVDAPGDEDSLDDYFDRLDAAFADLDGPATDVRRPGAKVGPLPEHSGGPVMERELDYLDDVQPHRTLGPASAAPAPDVHQQEDEPAAVDVSEIPTLEELLGEVGGDTAAGEAFSIESVPVTAPPPPPAAPPPPTSGSRTSVAEAFSALLAVEQGEPGVQPVSLLPPPAPPAIDTEAIVNQVTERVLARLRERTGDAQDLVTRVVSEVAERLVWDEIQRIRNK